MRGDVGRALAALDESRTVDGDRKIDGKWVGDMSMAWSSILHALARMKSPALLYFCEIMYQDGVSIGDLSAEAKAAVETLLPPEVFDCTPQESLLSTLSAHPRFARRKMPAVDIVDGDELWPKTKGLVSEVDCEQSETLARKALERARAERRPVVLRGIGKKWRSRDWTPDSLAHAFERGAVCRVSPSLAVSFCRESHPDVAEGRVTPPSVTLVLSGNEALRRILDSDAEESVYLQALASSSLMDDVDGLKFTHPDGRRVTARVWASRAGVFSPLHFDKQDSHLVQVVGAKRMVLWPPEALRHLRPYPDDHALARRCRVDVLERGRRDFLEETAANDDDALSLVQDSSVEAVLLPGDSIWFPSEWAHHTVAHQHNDAMSPLSVSLSLREENGKIVGA